MACEDLIIYYLVFYGKKFANPCFTPHLCFKFKSWKLCGSRKSPRLEFQQYFSIPSSATWASPSPFLAVDILICKWGLGVGSGVEFDSI